MFGFEKLMMVRCSNCHSETSTFKKDQSPTLVLSDIFKCNNCDNEFTVREGIIQHLISPNIFSQLSYICNIQLYGSTKIRVGHAKTIHLEKKVPVIERVIITPGGNFAGLSHLITGEDKIDFISSQLENGGAKVGEELEVDWVVYGNDGQTDISTWERLMVHAKDEMIKGQYNLSLLTSAMAFESFIDLLLEKLLESKGVPEKAAEVILDSMRSIYDKVHKLLPELSGVNIKEEKQINKNWQVGVVEKRNDIAHGETTSISKEEAELAFETVVRAIFYIQELSPINV